MKNIITLIILFTTTLTQAQSLSQSIEQQINSAREKGNSTALNWSSYGEEEKSEAIPSLKTYRQDSLLSVRLKAYDLLYQLMLNSNEIDTRQATLQAFLQGLNDEERAVQGFIADRFQAAEAEVYTAEMRNLPLARVAQHNACG